MFFITYIATTILYFSISFINVYFFTSTSLFFSSKSHGFGLDSKSTSLTFTYYSISRLATQILFFAPVLAYFGGSAERLFKLAITTFLGFQSILPIFLLINNHKKIVFTLICLVMLLVGGCEPLGYLSVLILLTEAQAPQNLGKAHGFASTMAAVSRTLAPLIAGETWDICGDLGLSWMIFIVGSVTPIAGVVISDYIK